MLTIYFCEGAIFEQVNWLGNGYGRSYSVLAHFFNLNAIRNNRSLFVYAHSVKWFTCEC